MNKVVNYAYLRYCPFRDTGEFANVGVVAHCPQDGKLAWRIAPDLGRVAAFFNGADMRALDAALRGREEVFSILAKGKVDLDCFREMTRPRERILTLGPPGTMVAGLEDAIDALSKRIKQVECGGGGKQTRES